MAKEKGKKPIYKQALFWVLMGVVLAAGLLGGCTGSDTETDDGSSDVAAAEEEATEEEAEFAEQVIYDADGVTITITGFEDSWGSTEMSVTIVNDGDANIDVTVDDFSVDGVMSDGIIWTDVTAGKTAVEETYLDVDVDELVGTFEGTISIYDNDTYDDIADTTFSFDF